MSCKKKYLVPVKALSKLIRGKFAARLRRSHKDLYRHVDPRTWSKDWVVHSLHYGQGEHVVLNYLARYVFRIAITNHRIISMDQSHVTFRYKDRKGGRWVTCRIEGVEFIRRYLQHVLPKGFHKVRYYGIWHKSNANHVSTLASSIILAAILSGRPITQRENEEPPITGSTPAMALGLATEVWSVLRYVCQPVHVSDLQRQEWAEMRNSLAESALDVYERKKSLPFL